jgi:hypothetical protein
MDFDDMMLDHKLDHVIAMNNLDAASDEANRKSIESEIVGHLVNALADFGDEWALGNGLEVIASTVFRAIERGDIPHVRIEY